MAFIAVSTHGFARLWIAVGCGRRKDTARRFPTTTAGAAQATTSTDVSLDIQCNQSVSTELEGRRRPSPSAKQEQEQEQARGERLGSLSSLDFQPGL